MSGLACVVCIAEFERHEIERPDAAFVVYKGKSLCSKHHNTGRGLPEYFVRYPTPAGAGDTETS